MSAALTNTLGALKRRSIALGLSAGVAWGLLIGSAVVLLAMWLDLVLDLPPYLRIGGGGMALLAAGGLVIGVAGVAWRRATPWLLARRLDDAAKTGGQVLSGVDLLLSGTCQTSMPLTDGLAQMAIGRAAQIAAQVPPAKAAPAKAIAWPYAGVAAMVVAGVIVSIAAPRLVRTQWARFLDPMGDHPPYSRLVITVEPGNARVTYGSPLEIRATIGNGVAESVEVAIQNEDGTADVLPMFPESGGKWRGTLTSVTTAGSYCVRTHGARSRRYSIELMTVPRIGAVRFRITPPAYTHRPTYDGPLPQGGIAGLPGTSVELWAKSNRPLSGGELAFVSSPTTRPTTQPMLAVGSGSSEVAGAFVIRQAGQIRLTVTDITGQTSSDVYTAPVAVLADARPFVRILEPKPQSLATPDAVLQVQISAEDDYGISRLMVFRGLNESRMRQTQVTVPPTAPTRMMATVPLPLADYGVSPGDVVKLFGRVEDNDPAGAKGSESPITTIQIISQDEMQRLMVAQQGLETLLSKYEQANRRLEAIREKLDKLLKALNELKGDAPLPEALNRELAELAKMIEENAKEVGKAAQQKLPFDLDKALNPELEKLAKAMEDAAKDAKKLAGGMPNATAAAKGVEEIAKALGKEAKEFEEDVNEPLDRLEKVFPLKEDEAEFVVIYERQRDLADRLVSLSGVSGEDNPAVKSRMRELEEEQRQIREDLRGLLDKIDTDAARLPEGPEFDDLSIQATRFARAARESGAMAKMQAAEGALAEFRGSAGQAAANEAAEILRKLMPECNGMGDQAGRSMSFQPKLQAGLGNTVEQLLEGEGLGSGDGGGGGAGYSMRRSTLRNVGLYGSRPLRSEDSKAGNGRDASAGGAKGRRGALDRAGDELDVSQGQRAVGSAEVPTPPQYRRRVGDYFQRVADEIEQK